ncbi:MAG: SpoIIE family protein phosphatase [Thermoflexales bacterium]|nr:SpoIIE family protein phosphatase [Thermoflexales bacterium]
MYVQYTVYLVAVLLAALIAAALAIYSWQHRDAPGAPALAGLMVLASWWSLVDGLSLISRAPASVLAWHQLAYISAASLPVAWLVFALQYTQRQAWLSPRRLVSMAIVPSITQVMIWTNEAHHLWMLSKPDLLQEGPFTPIVIDNAVTPGPWFGVHLLYSVILILLGMILLVQASIRAFRLYQGQAVALVLAVLASLGINLAQTLGLTHLKVDPTPLAFVLSGSMLAWAVFRYRLLDVVPVARDTLIDNMSDGMLVLDAHDRIVDINPAMQSILHASSAQVIGQPAAQVLGPWRDMVEHFQPKTDAQAEVVLGQGDELHHYDLGVSVLTNRHAQPSGWLIVMRDITTRVRAEEAEKEAVRREMDLAREIQMSLLPTSAPNIPGLEIAGLSFPAREVGGDLYNYYNVPPAGWAIAVGDVSGKGIPAALYMAVSTTMLAAKAAFVPDVAQLMTEMNAALYPYMSGRQMNTALCYVRLEAVPEAETASRYIAHVANAGLVAPVLRRGTQCEYLAVGGLPLGAMVAGFPYRALDLPLQTSDMLVMATDGIIEALNGAGEMYGFDRFLARVASAPAAASDAIHWLVADVQAFMGDAEQHDDLTVVVIRLTGLHS